MAFQANKWGLKALAARLLLAPVLAGCWVTDAVAQQYPSSGVPRAGVPATAGAPAAKDTKELLKMGRQALAAGNFDAARDFARQAEAMPSSGRWGFASDSPESLMKDVMAAQAKANKAESEKLVRQAKDLFTRPARSEQERAANVEQAAQLIDRAVSLAANSDGFLADINPFAEKPEALKREIDAVRAQLRAKFPVANAQPNAGTPRAMVGTPRGSTPIQQTGHNQPLNLEPRTNTAPSFAGHQQQMVDKLMVEGQLLLSKELYAEARSVFIEADKLGTAPKSGPTPGQAINETMALGKAKINRLVGAAQGHADRQDWSNAVKSMTEARDLAAKLDLRTTTLDEDLAQIQAIANASSKTVLAQATEVPPLPGIAAPETELPKPLTTPGLPTVPSLPMGPSVPTTPSVPETPPVSVPDSPKPMLPGKVEPELTLPELGGTGLPRTPETKPSVAPGTATVSNHGEQLLKDAAQALKAGELEHARELATKAHNGEYGDTVKKESLKVIREVDAEQLLMKKKEAVEGLKAATEAYTFKQYESAKALISRIHADLLTPEQQKQLDKLTLDTTVAMQELKALALKNTQAPAPTPGTTPALIPSTPTAGTPTAQLNPTTPPVKVADQLGALSEVEFQQLRDEGLRTETQARQSFDKGETDVAIQMLTDFSNKVKSSRLSAAKQSLILNPVERRLDGFRMMKHHFDFYTKEAKSKREQVENRLAKASAEQQKQEEIASRVKQVQDLLKAHNYKKAEELALQTKQLDPENPTLGLVYELAKRNRRQEEATMRKAEKEVMYYEGMNAAEKQGPFVDTQDPVAVMIDRSRRNMLRGSADDLFIRTRTPIEREIELKLEKPLTLKFQNAPLREVISKFRDAAQMNIVVDDSALSAEGIELDKLQITEEITSPIALRSVMNIMFQKHGLQHVIEDDVVKVTTTKKAKGRLYTKVFSVMDLVTPIPDFALPEHAVLSKALERQANPQQPWTNMAPTINTPQGGLNNGQLVGGMNGFNGGRFDPSTAAGQLQATTTPGAPQNHPLASSAHLAPTKANASAQLMKLVTGMVRPYSWQDMGGPGKIDYYDIGGAMVVNQTADVIKEITDLLESLRRLQDLSIAVEIRVVSLTEDFYERVGVDFAMNVKTNNNLNFERQLTTGQFRPEPFLNSIDTSGTVVGWIPPQGGFTSDLRLPIRPNSYGFSVPPFGNYPGNLNGGLNLGLAFLNDIQVFLFMEAAAGNRRINVMQAPKITLFNGQTSTVSVQDFQYFTTSLSVTNVGGQFVYVPQNTPLPVGGGGGFGQPGVTIAVQGVVSSDRRFVRMTLTPSFTVLNSATVPLFPITAFITPVFEGGSQGVPIPFTQFFQQPAFQTISVQTTVAVPDGGTVLMGGLKTMSEGRNEFGPPVLSNIPYLNRLFKNTGIGRETRHIMLMVTPRIIINLEEELTQTGVQ